MKQYDGIIIGSGQAANPLALRLASAGWKLALVEKKHIGGTCINEGCTPTKVMVASGKFNFQLHRAKEYGLHTVKATIDIGAVINRKNRIVHRFRNSLESGLLEQENIELLYGEAVFTGNKQITVTGANNKIQQITAPYIFINTGARPFIPFIRELETVPFFTSTSILNLEEIPEHLVIVGAGPVAIEFAQIYRRFGSRVTVICRTARLLPREDADVSEALKSILEDEGVIILFETNTERVGINSNNLTTVQVSNKNGRYDITGTHLLMATGRRANCDALELEKTGVAIDERGYIIVNEKLETTAAGIYALGDVKGGPAFTHISYNDYLVVCKNIAEGKNVSITNRVVPFCIFTDPEFGRVGLNESEALSQKIPFTVAKLPMSFVARATETGEHKGFIKAIVHAETKKILGVAVIAVGGGELMSLLQIAMLGGITASQLAENIFAHPTYAESINSLFNGL